MANNTTHQRAVWFCHIAVATIGACSCSGTRHWPSGVPSRLEKWSIGIWIFRLYVSLLRWIFIFRANTKWLCKTHVTFLIFFMALFVSLKFGLCWFVVGEKHCSFAEKYCWSSSLKSTAQIFLWPCQYISWLPIQNTCCLIWHSYGS